MAQIKAENPYTVVPGEIHFADDEIVINADRKSETIVMENKGDRPVQIGSHFHLYEVNPAMAFYDAKGNLDAERLVVWGKRFDIPSGTAIRFEPNEKKQVNIIPLAGTREVYGLDNLVDGPLGNGPKTPYTKAKGLK